MLFREVDFIVTLCFFAFVLTEFFAAMKCS